MPLPRSSLRFPPLILFLFFIPSQAQAQAPQTGLPPYGSFESGIVDTTNRQNLNTLVSLDVSSTRGRGLGFNMQIFYNSLIWYPSGGAWTPNGSGWNTNSIVGGSVTYTTKSSQQNCGPASPTPGPMWLPVSFVPSRPRPLRYRAYYGTKYTYSNYVYTEQNGARHTLPISGVEDGCGAGYSGTAANTTDGSGFRGDATQSPDATVRDRSGTLLFVNSAVMKDSNGNYISYTTPSGEVDYTDTAGHLVLKLVSSSSTIKYEYQDPTGAYQTITLNLATYNVKTAFNCTGVTEYTGSWSLPALVLATLFCPSVIGKQGQESQCARKEIPLTLHDERTLTVLHSWLSFEKTLEGEVTLRNTSPKAIKAATLVVLYLDGNGNTLFTITYEANVKGYGNTEHNIRPFHEMRLKRNVEPGDAIYMWASNFLSTTEVPVRAIVSIDNITFADGTAQDSGTTNPPWRSQPMLDRADGPINLSLDLQTEPLRADFRLTIDEYGNVKGVEPLGANPLTAAQTQSLSRQLSIWHFFPAIEGGYGVAASLPIVLLFLPDNAPPTHHCFLNQPSMYPKLFAFFTLERAQGRPDSWQAYYNGYPVDATFPHRHVID